MSFDKLKYSSEKNTVIKKFLVPQRIVACNDTDKENMLLCDTPRQSAPRAENCTTVRRGGYVLLDFGCEFQGGIDLTVQVSIPRSRIRIVFGESVSEALSSIGVKNATNNHSVRDMIVETCSMSSMRYGNTGFRFVKIEPIDNDILIRGVKGVFEYKDLEYKGSFECSDALLNTIWNTAAYTVHLNMQDYIWDGIKRDRLVWIGDMHPEVSTITSVFGYDASVEKSLDYIRDETPLNRDFAHDDDACWMNTLPSYTLWWIKIHRDWYYQNGSKEYLNQQKDYMYAAAKLILPRIHDDGSLDFPSYFVDWSSKDTPAEEPGFRGCLVLALRAAAEIFAVYDDAGMSKKCLDKIGCVAKALHDFPTNKQMAAIVSLAGLADSKAVSDGVIKKDLLQGLSTFYGYYVLHALAKSGDTQAAIDVMRGFWGAMLRFGATTFWEDFDIRWIENAAPIDDIVPEGKADIHGDYGKFCYTQLRHSLCHGWASGPAPFMTKHILGVGIAEPGCRKLIITPHLGDLEWVRGTYPTPYGTVTIEHRKENGKIVSKIDVPDEITVEVNNG